VSMTPVRKALRDLATEGLVTLLAHKGAAVTSLDLADAKEIHAIRLKSEPDATHPLPHAEESSEARVRDEVTPGSELLSQHRQVLRLQ
jgi:DNA-binding GntR family transcriptional regulator